MALRKYSFLGYGYGIWLIAVFSLSIIVLAALIVGNVFKGWPHSDEFLQARATYEKVNNERIHS